MFFCCCIQMVYYGFTYINVSGMGKNIITSFAKFITRLCSCTRMNVLMPFVYPSIFSIYEVSFFLFWEDIQYLAIFGQKYDLSCKVPAVATVIYHILYAPVVFCFISLTFLCPLILVFQSHYSLLSFIYDFLTNFPFCLKKNFLDDIVKS